MTLVEQFVSKLSLKSNAKLDVCAWSAYPPAEHYFDVVVSHPCAPAYLQNAIYETGTTAAAAADKKRNKYGPDVTPWSLETYGAFDDTLLASIKDLANMASARDRSMGYVPRPYLKLWKAQISATLARSFALALRSATCECNSVPLPILSSVDRFSRMVDAGVITHPAIPPQGVQVLACFPPLPPAPSITVPSTPPCPASYPLPL